MIVTGLRPDARIPGYLVVEVDRHRYAALPAEVVSALGLKPGLELDDQAKAELEAAVSAEGAYRVALRLLAAKPRASGELRRKLKERGHAPPAVDAALEKLESAGLLNDYEFARHFVRVRTARGHGRPRLIADLLQLGVDRALAEKAVEEVVEVEGVDELDQVRRLVEKRLAQLEDVPPKVRKRRVLAYLRRRGIGGSAIRQILEEMLSQRC